MVIIIIFHEFSLNSQFSLMIDMVQQDKRNLTGACACGVQWESNTNFYNLCPRVESLTN